MPGIEEVTSRLKIYHCFIKLSGIFLHKDWSFSKSKDLLIPCMDNNQIFTVTHTLLFVKNRILSLPANAVWSQLTLSLRYTCHLGETSKKEENYHHVINYNECFTYSVLLQIYENSYHAKEVRIIIFTEGFIVYHNGWIASLCLQEHIYCY